MKHVVLVGQSAGGFASLAAASYAPEGLVAVVNFSGGRGGHPLTHPGTPCGAHQMADTVAHFATTTRVPVLWHYVQNDEFFAPDEKSSKISPLITTARLPIQTRLPQNA
jgi:dienelactone hydrolase